LVIIGIIFAAAMSGHFLRKVPLGEYGVHSFYRR
jgi:hypothetical protein